MKSITTQRGMTMWSLLFVLGVLALVMFLFLKLFAPYKDDFKVRTALDSLVRQPDISSMGKNEIIEALSKRFDIDDISHVKLGTDLTVETKGKLKVIRIKYEAVIPMVYNISALLEFDHVRQVRASGGE